MIKENNRLSAVLDFNNRIIKNRKNGYLVDDEMKKLQNFTHQIATYAQHLNDCTYHSNDSDCTCGLLDILQLINQFEQP
jgi:hypothetical protein